MTVLLSCEELEKSLGNRVLFEGLNLHIQDRERIGLIGPNGSGKSTLLKMLAETIYPDSGEVILHKHSKLVYVPQVEEINPELTILEAALEASQDDLIDADEKEANAIIMLSRIGFESFTDKVGDISGGWLKRLSIARQLARNPDVVLIDEPTNHLDIDGINWLENYLRKASFAYILISHDRFFLEKVTNRIIELNEIFDGGILSFNCAYEEYSRRRQEFLIAERARYESLANKSRREQEWTKAGVQGRGTKQKARLREAANLFGEVNKLKKQTTQPDKILAKFEKTDRKTKRLVVAHNISKSFGEKIIIKDLDLTLSPKIRIGLLGLNGVGKTTLMKMIGGEEPVDSGKVNVTNGCKILHFDQKRQLTDDKKTLREVLSLGGDTVLYHGKTLHVGTWARKLRFRGDQLDTPVSALSGGERARVIMGRLMQQTADVLLLDEPTNDLDIQSLEALEASLMDFPGAIMLVTHDRAMLDRVSTILLSLDGEGNVTPYASYQQWQDAQEGLASPKNNGKNGKFAGKSAGKNSSDAKNNGGKSNQSQTSNSKDGNDGENSQAENQASQPAKKITKLSYNEQREWDMMEGKILDAEGKISMLEENPVSADNAKEFSDYCQSLAQAQQDVEELYLRWSELEEVIASF